MSLRVDYDERAIDQAAAFLDDPPGIRAVLDAIDRLAEPGTVTVEGRSVDWKSTSPAIPASEWQAVDQTSVAGTPDATLQRTATARWRFADPDADTDTEVVDFNQTDLIAGDPRD